LADGDENAFGQLYTNHHDYLYKFILKYVKSPDIAEDLTQETFIRLWEFRNRLTKVDSFKAYLFTAGRNHTLNFLKKASKESAAKGEILRYYRHEPQTTEDKMVSDEYRKFIKDVLDSLPVQTREVFRLCREQNKSYDEVATILGISRNAVKKHMVRSHKTFKDLMGDNADVPLIILLVLFLKF
jgi:RNA polymerase sigma-70 factor (family 1)